MWELLTSFSFASERPQFRLGGAWLTAPHSNDRQGSKLPEGKPFPRNLLSQLRALPESSMLCCHLLSTQFMRGLTKFMQAAENSHSPVVLSPCSFRTFGKDPPTYISAENTGQCLSTQLKPSTGDLRFYSHPCEWLLSRL